MQVQKAKQGNGENFDLPMGEMSPIFDDIAPKFSSFKDLPELHPKFGDAQIQAPANKTNMSFPQKQAESENRPSQPAPK